MIFSPPKPDQLLYGTMLNAGLGTSTVVADFDFETYSPAGFVWDEQNQKWGCLPNAKNKGLPTTGVARYAEHPDAEVLCLAYNLKDGRGARLWKPTDPHQPTDLFDHINSGRLLEAWNVSFEFWVWQQVCVPKYGFPPLPAHLIRCAAAKARAWALPSSLANAGDVMNINTKKDKDGSRLLKLFSMPRDPTVKDKRLRIMPAEDPENAKLLYDYNLRDIEAEAELSSFIPDLPPFELEFWQKDLLINQRGVAVDTLVISNCLKILDQAYKKYNAELYQITGGEVSRASEVQKTMEWINENAPGLDLQDLTSETVEETLKKNIPPDIRRILEIRSIIGSAAVKKLYAMSNTATQHGRIHDLFIYHSARTGRAAGTGVQPQNLPNSGQEVWKCWFCNRHFSIYLGNCPWCDDGKKDLGKSRVDWGVEAVEDVLTCINTASLECLELFFGDPIAAISGCLRSLLISRPGYDLICSDYSAIEAVVLAELAEESWRQDVFRTHGKIYEMSASKITGIPFEEFEKYKTETGQHHPMRKKVGKVAELASGYQGWIGAWKAFGAEEFFNKYQMKDAILAWRKASPAIVNFWGGQYKNYSPNYYGIEGMAILAVMSPGVPTETRGIEFVVKNDILYCKLLSGRYLTYHRPRLKPSEKRKGLSLSYEGWNTNPKNGPIGWIRMNTYGGKLVENIVQATARDLLAFAVVNLENAGYPVVIHVHDEIVCEIPENWGTIQEFEEKMSTMPSWANGWPVKASGGWRGKRYRK